MLQDNVQQWIQDDTVLYILLSLVATLLGGIDDELTALIMLHIVYFVTCFVTSKSVDFKQFVKIYIVIVIGNILDNLLKFSTSLRNYIVLFYTYNVLVDLINTLQEDGKFKLPKQVQKTIKKIKKE